MTRINVVPVDQLSGPHLVAEYRELPRVFGYAHRASLSTKPWTDKQPKRYTMGTGHMTFFYDKLQYLADRHKELVQEMLRRGYKPLLQGCLVAKWVDMLPSCYWKTYSPDSNALAINQARIDERNS